MFSRIRAVGLVVPVVIVILRWIFALKRLLLEICLPRARLETHGLHRAFGHGNQLVESGVIDMYVALIHLPARVGHVNLVVVG